MRPCIPQGQLPAEGNRQSKNAGGRWPGLQGPPPGPTSGECSPQLPSSVCRSLQPVGQQLGKAVPVQTLEQKPQWSGLRGLTHWPLQKIWPAAAAAAADAAAAARAEIMKGEGHSPTAGAGVPAEVRCRSVWPPALLLLAGNA